MGRALIAAAVLLALAGCSTVAAPPPGLSVSERAALQDRLRERAWQNTGLPDDSRPPDPLVVEVPIDEWGETYERCMANAGFPSYQYNGGDQPDDVTMAEYVCNVSLWPDAEQGWYNAAQLGYLYDYFDQTLVPCIALHGGEVVDAPSRQEFFELFGGWSPYTSMRAADTQRIFSDKTVLRDCPPMPPGMDDPGYAGLWS